jgi:hypothetical protein
VITPLGLGIFNVAYVVWIMPKDAVVPDIEAAYLERQHLLVLVVPCSTGHLQVDASDRSGRLPWDDPVKRILYQGQVLQIVAHLNEGFPHDKIQ